VYSVWLAPLVISVLTFGMCILLGIPLTAGHILSAIATFGVLQEALSSFPELISVYAETKVGTKSSHTKFSLGGLVN
jgi:ATP-binding cassette subfamily C (CFTR/MRP) protein 2